MQCPACTAELPEEDLFCENCGQPLNSANAPPSATTCTCGAPPSEIDPDGFCERCGRRVRRPPTDHIEEVLAPTFAAVSDRGIRHDRNEDRFAILQTPDASVIVVCDGVSATRKSEIASAAVSQGVAESLAAALHAGPIADPEAAMRQAIAAGIAGLAAQVSTGDRDAPSTTVVAALVSGGTATIGWMGDSRAYWIGPEGVQPLTRDHSWMNEAIAAGIAAAQVEHSPKAHAITRWIGADSGDETTPDVVRQAIAAPGILLLCTDGLRNPVQTHRTRRRPHPLPPSRPVRQRQRRPGQRNRRHPQTRQRHTDPSMNRHPDPATIPHPPAVILAQPESPYWLLFVLVCQHANAKRN
jgi:serine/threonine protein phosphatase PrpC